MTSPQRDYVSEVLREEFDGRWRPLDAFLETSLFWQVLCIWLASRLIPGIDVALAPIITLGLTTLAIIATAFSLIANKLGAPYAKDPRHFRHNLKLIDRRIAEKKREHTPQVVSTAYSLRFKDS